MSKHVFVPSVPSFDLGHIVATQGAMAATTHEQRLRCLKRHSIGDWGSVCPEDWQSNDDAVKDGYRILSAYPIDPGKPCKGFGENTLRKSPTQLF